MGVRPDGHADFMFNGKAPQPQDGHPVPVSNFMNAQCMSQLSSRNLRAVS